MVSRLRLSLRRSRPLQARERRMLMLAALVTLVFASSTLLPAVRGSWQQRQAELFQLRDAVAREQRLLEEAALWQQRREGIEAREQALAEEVFAATTVPLLSAAIQQQVRQLASRHGIQITSASVAESRPGDGWLLVEQRLDFTLGNQAGLPQFLQQLDSARPRLDVRHFSLRHARNQYTGQLTVVGFARLEPAP